MKIAVLVGPDYEDSEFEVPVNRLREAGHTIEVVGARAGEALSGKSGNSRTRVERGAADLTAREFDALVIPGGYGPDHLRMDTASVRLVREFAHIGRPLAVICHGPQLLIEADVVRGKRLTSWPSIKKDLENAGAIWVDAPVVTDGALITSRKPDDLDQFVAAIEQRLTQKKPLPTKNAS